MFLFLLWNSALRIHSNFCFSFCGSLATSSYTLHQFCGRTVYIIFKLVYAMVLHLPMCVLKTSVFVRHYISAFVYPQLRHTAYASGKDRCGDADTHIYQTDIYSLPARYISLSTFIAFPCIYVNYPCTRLCVVRLACLYLYIVCVCIRSCNFVYIAMPPSYVVNSDKL